MQVRAIHQRSTSTGGSDHGRHSVSRRAVPWAIALAVAVILAGPLTLVPPAATHSDAQLAEAVRNGLRTVTHFIDPQAPAPAYNASRGPILVATMGVRH